MMRSLLYVLPLLFHALQQEGAAAFSFSGTTSHHAVQLHGPRSRCTVSKSMVKHVRVYQKGPLMLSAAQEGGDMDTKIEGRKKRVIMGYKATMLAYLAVGLSSAIRGGITKNFLHMIAGYIVMPAGISYILISAASNNRLNSDTYKRLNLSLIEYGLVGLVIVSLGGLKRRNAVMALAFALSVINSIKGFAYGVLGWDKKSTDTTLLKDFTKGTQDTIKGFFSIPKNAKSFGYMIATFMVASLKLLKLKEIIEFIQVNSFAEGLAMPLSRFNRLALLALSIYTLKDAADRDRLGGTTFIQMNYLCSISALVNFYFYTSGITTPLGALSAFFSAFFAFNGITSYMKNQYA